MMSSTLMTSDASPAIAAPYDSQPALRPIVSVRKYARLASASSSRLRISRGQELDRREIAEREVDAHVVVVDRLGQVDDGDSLRAGRQPILKHLELVGRLQRVVAADADQGIDAQRQQRRHRRGAAARTACGSSRCDGCEMSLPGLVRAVPIMIPCVFRDRFSKLDCSLT